MGKSIDVFKVKKKIRLHFKKIIPQTIQDGIKGTQNWKLGDQLKGTLSCMSLNLYSGSLPSIFNHTGGGEQTKMQCHMHYRYHMSLYFHFIESWLKTNLALHCWILD